MPFKNVNTTLGEEYHKNSNTQLANYLKSMKEANVYDVSIKNKDAKINLDTSGLWNRQLEALMTTRLEGQRMKNFYNELPDFLRWTENCDMNILYSKQEDKEKDNLWFEVNFKPGIVQNKQPILDKLAKTFIAEAIVPGGYSGKELDGFYTGSMGDDDAATKYLKTSIEVEKLGFIRERIDPQKGKCVRMTCINPWEMVEKEFIDFTKSMMQKNETQKLTIAANNYSKKDKLYGFKATVFPKSNNVEVATIGWKYPDDVGRMFGRSLNLFGVSLSNDDKVSYRSFYKEENKTREALKNGATKVGKGIVVPFAFAGSGILSGIDAVRGRWDNYQNKKQRKIDELKEEIRSYGIQPNRNRKGSCFIAIDKSCLLKNIEDKKKAQSTQTQP